MVKWQLEALSAAGIDSLAVVTGYLKHRFNDLEIKRIHNERWAQTNMVASMLCALEHVGGTVVFSYSDILYDASVVRLLLESPGDFVVAYDTRWLEIWSQRFEDPLSDAESFRIAQSGRIEEIGQKAQDTTQIQGQFMGLFKVSAAAARWINELALDTNVPMDELDTTGLLNLMIQRGMPISGVPIAGHWMEVDNQQDLQLAEQMMRSGFLILKNFGGSSY
jgi:L-glutamine-phosphate cytidylyltransferase